jgi:hypothetical protein
MASRRSPKLKVALLCAAVLGLVAAEARAGTLSSATWTTELYGYLDRIFIEVPVVATGTSTSSSVAVSLLLPQFLGGAFGTAGAIPTHRQLRIHTSASQLLTATPSMAAATTGVFAIGTQKVAVHAAKGANASMLTPGKTTLLKLPLSVGADDTLVTYFTNPLGGSTHFLTIDFYGWSPGMHTFTGLTTQSMALPSVMAVGSFDLTAMGAGAVLLVAPTRIWLDGPLHQRRQVYLSTLRLEFVPEPGALLLLGAGGLAVLFLARRIQP